MTNVREAELIGARVPFTELPVIDVGSLRDGSDPSATVHALTAAARDVGFFYVINHGVPSALVGNVFEQMRRFFALPLEDKHAIALTARKRLGYMETGRQSTEDTADGDLVEGMEHGLEIPADDPDADFPFYGPNRWPALPGYRETMLEYSQAMMGLGRALLQGLASGLGVPWQRFDAAMAKPIMLLSPRRYPPQTGHITRRRIGVNAHTDYGCVTMVTQDEVGGLQVRNSAGRWIEASPLPDSFVCNLGELLERWTNGRLVATEHRVINDAGAERYSCVFFYNPGRRVRVECLPECCDAQHPPRYPGVDVGEHYLKRMRFYD